MFPSCLSLRQHGCMSTTTSYQFAIYLIMCDTLRVNYTCLLVGYVFSSACGICVSNQLAAGLRCVLYCLGCLIKVMFGDMSNT